MKMKWLRAQSEWFPLGVWAYLVALLLVGIAMVWWSFFPSEVDWLHRAAPKISSNWHRLVAIYLFTAMGATAIISYISHRLLHWYRIADFPRPQQRCHLDSSVLWPPVMVGIAESVLYPTALLMGAREFIGVWLALKVIGGWGGWTSATPEARNRVQRFLFNSSLSLAFGVLTYGLVKAFVMIPKP